MQGQKTILSMNKTDDLKCLTNLQVEKNSHLTPLQLTVLDTDFSLDAMQLDDKYNPDGDGEHPVFARGHWRTEVAAQNTITGYWEWVEKQVDEHHHAVV